MIKKIKSIGILFVIFVTSVFLFTGCGSGSASSNPNQSKESESQSKEPENQSKGSEEVKIVLASQPSIFQQKI